MKKTILNPNFISSVEYETKDPFGSNRFRVLISMTNKNVFDYTFDTPEEAKKFVDKISMRLPTEAIVVEQ